MQADLVSAFAALPLPAATLSAVLLWLLALVPAHVLSHALSFSYALSPLPVRADWLSRCNSSLHALLSVTGFALALTSPTSPTPFHTIYVLSLGYFLSDSLIVSLFHQTISAPLPTLAHHALSSAAIAFVLAHNTPLSCTWGAVLFLTEASTPLINLRYFLAIRHRHHRRYKITGALMTLAFLAARPVGIPLLMLWIARRWSLLTAGLSVEDLRLFTGVGVAVTSALYVLNLYWSVVMVRGLVRALRIRDPPCKEEKGD